MASTDISNPENPRKQNTEQPVSKSAKKKYDQSLAYERAFLKKKEELENASRVRQLKADIHAIRQDAAMQMTTQAKLLGDTEAATKALNQIKRKMAEDLIKKELELLAEKQESEYRAHQFAIQCAEKAFQTQTVHERAVSAAALAEAQKVQTEKLRAVKEAEIEELQSQHKVAESSSEKRKITLAIKKLQKEIADAEAQEATQKEQAARYAEIVKKVEFDRLSATEKLALKEKEIADLQAQSDAAVAEIDSAIIAKQIDLEAATEAGDKSLAESLRKDIADLRATRDSTVAEYSSSIDTVKQTIEGAGGLKEQASKETPETAVAVPQFVSDGIAQGKSPLQSQVDTIVGYLSDLVSVFHTYVDTIESRVSPEVVVSTVVPSDSSPTPAGSKPDAQPVVEYLRALVMQTTSDDAEAQAEMIAKLDAMSKIDITEGLDSEQGQEDLKLLVGTIQEFFENAEEKQRKGEEEDSEEGGTGTSDKDNLKKSVKEQALEYLYSTDEHKPGVIQREKNDSRERTIEGMAANERLKHGFTEQGAKENLAKGLQALADSMENLSKTIDEKINHFYQYQAQIDARLQGSQNTFTDTIKTLTRNIGMSAVISQEEFIGEFQKLVDAGITYNLESRTLLATVSDKVISTFEVLNADLQRLIRLQQADTTAARMGIESSLNKLLNSMYSDSSYLSSSIHDSITGSILQASSMLSRDMSVEFEYAVHKWLGSLYSLGMSESTLNKIAEGLNYLGTGNVTALNNNDSLQTLLAMSSNYGGIAYADILTQGLNAENTNKLMSGMLKYLMEIANNTDSSQVTKSAYTDIFGLEMSDFRAIMNVTESDIESLNKLNMTYTSAVQETQDQIDSIIKRTHISQMIDTLFENAVLGASLDIGKNAVTYGLWKTINVIEGLTGGIALPFVNIFGSGFDLNTTVTGLLKGGMAGLALLGNLVTSLGGGGGLDGRLDLTRNWEMTEFTSRGSAADFLTTGTESGFSTSARLDYNGSGSGSDMKRTEMSDSTDSAQEDSEITNKNVQDSQEIPEKIYEQTQLIWGALADKDNTLLKQTVATYQLLDERLDFTVFTAMRGLLASSRVFLTSSVDSLGGLRSLAISSDGALTSTTYQAYTTSLANVSTALTEAVKHTSSVVGENVLNRSSLDIWSIIQEISDTNLSNSDAYLQLMSNSYSTELENISEDQKTVNNTLLSAIAGVVGDQKSENARLANDLKTVAEVQALNKIVFPEYVRATIDDYSPSAQKFLQQVLKAAIQMNFGDSTTSTNSVDDDQHPIVTQLVKAFHEMLTGPQTVITTKEEGLLNTLTIL